jgi:hypothetical protein
LTCAEAQSAFRHHLTMANPYPTWDEWLTGLSEDERAETLALRDRYDLTLPVVQPFLSGDSMRVDRGADAL